MLDDYEVVSPRSEQQVRNAYAAAAWRQQYERRAQCPDLRDDDLRARGDRVAERMAEARRYVRLCEDTRRAIQRALQLELDQRVRNVVPFPRHARR